MPSNRLVTGTIDADRRVTFNEVWLKDDLPDKVIFLAIDRALGGVHLWLTPYQQLEEIVTPQVDGYSVAISRMQVGNPPNGLGTEWFIPADRFSDGLWNKLISAKTNALKKAGEEALIELFDVQP